MKVLERADVGGSVVEGVDDISELMSQEIVDDSVPSTTPAVVGCDTYMVETGIRRRLRTGLLRADFSGRGVGGGSFALSLSPHV